MREFIKIVLPYIKPYRINALLNIVLNIVGSIFSLFSLILLMHFLGILFDSQKLVLEKPELTFSSDSVMQYFNYHMSQVIVSEGQIKALVYVSIFILATVLFKNLFIYFANFFMAPLRNGIVKDIRNKIYNKVLNLHMGFFSKEKKGDIISRMTSDAQEFEWSAIASIEMIFRDPILIIIYFTSLLLISPYLTLLILVLLPISGFIIGRIGKSLKKSSAEARTRMGTLLSYMEETIGGLRIIKAFNAEQKIEQKFSNENWEYTKVVNRVFRREYLASPLSEFLGVLPLINDMYYGATMVLGEQSGMSPEVFIGYIAIFSQVINPAKAVTSAYYRIQKGLAAMDRINVILDTEISIKEQKNAQSIAEFNNKIVFENVHFKYTENDVLKNINIEVKKGNTLALVGQSGSGKSTL
ncbi:MAG: ABC transporter ATP-binding protein, partial [Bacteroidetes bacterium]